MKVHDVVAMLEQFAPPQLAAEWDNVGLLIGDEDAPVSKMMLCIDLTEGVLAEASRAKVQMVMAYHPVIFKPLARLTARAAPVAYEAARKGMAVYSMHTAFDAAPGGVNDVLAEAMGLGEVRPLEPTVREGGCKVVVFVTPTDAPGVLDAAFEAGAGRIGHYERCAFFSHGVGTFLGDPETDPAIGQAGREEAAEELRLEFVARRDKLADICAAIREAHSYETPAIDVYPLTETPPGCGMGRVGRLARPITTATLINRIKKSLGVRKLLLAGANGKGKLVSTAACCAGSGGSTFRSAVRCGATFYLTGEMRHHDALAARAAGLTVACVGHSNSERIALGQLADRISARLGKGKVVVSQTDADPFEIV